jgi:Polyketide cyclase / dehydrase and lipid transport
MRILMILWLALLPDWAYAVEWQLRAEVDGVSVYSRPRPGSSIEEVRAEGQIDASPPVVWAVLRDYERYKDVMPYTIESRVLDQEAPGKVVIFYSVLQVFWLKHDYVIRIVDESAWGGPNRFFKSSWVLWDKPPAVPQRQGVRRLLANEGYWLLQPTPEGSRTNATYGIFTVPDSPVPAWFINFATRQAIPEVFRQIEKRAKDLLNVEQQRVESENRK